MPGIGPGLAQATEASTHMTQVASAIRTAQCGTTIEARRRGAEQLAGLVRNDSDRQATIILVPRITALLGSSDDTVRYWIATALGNIGPAAKSAIPKLKKLLPIADCMNGPITSASAIRFALGRMGVRPPFPSEKCKNKISG